MSRTWREQQTKNGKIYTRNTEDGKGVEYRKEKPNERYVDVSGATILPADDKSKAPQKS